MVKGASYALHATRSVNRQHQGGAIVLGEAHGEYGINIVLFCGYQYSVQAKKEMQKREKKRVCEDRLFSIIVQVVKHC